MVQQQFYIKIAIHVTYGSTYAYIHIIILKYSYTGYKWLRLTVEVTGLVGAIAGAAVMLDDSGAYWLFHPLTHQLHNQIWKCLQQVVFLLVCVQHTVIFGLLCYTDE